MRVPSPHPTKGGGWLHKLDGQQVKPLPATAPIPELPSAELTRFAEQARTALSPARAARFGADMGLDVASLSRLSMGWAPADMLRKLGTKCRAEGCFTFPMRDEHRGVLGIRLRTTDNFKYSVTGGHEGLFIPTDLPTVGPLLICEGPTDLAALLDMDFPAIGRPSCQGAVELVIRVLQASARRDVVIVADNDGPGLEGARGLAAAIVARTRSTKVIAPPFVKDARAWKAAGATRKTVEAVIAAANYFRRTANV